MMTDDATIAALERAAEAAEYDAKHYAVTKTGIRRMRADAALIRAHIAKLRAADAVDERAKVTKNERTAAVIRELQEFLALPEDIKLMALYELPASDRQALRDAIEAGARQEAGE